MLTCEHVGELGDAYALGALDPEVAQELEQHLERCPTCRAQVEADQVLAATLTLAPPQVEPPAGLRASLLGAARGDGAGSIRPAWWRRLFPAPTRIAFGAASFASLAFVV